MQNINELLTFIENSPSPFHAVETISDRLDNAGFTRLYEQDDWKLEKGKGCGNGAEPGGFHLRLIEPVGKGYGKCVHGKAGAEGDLLEQVNTLAAQIGG